MRSQVDRSFRRRAIAVALTIVLGSAVAVAPGLSATAGVDARSKAAVGAAYRDVLLPALAADLGWTGSTGSCSPGTISKAAQKGTLVAVNYMRTLSGLSKVEFDKSLSAKAQKAALVYAASNDIDHYFEPRAGGGEWECLSAVEADAKAAGLASNLAYGSAIAGPLAVLGYMEDPGTVNTVAGHRRWILNPSAKTMGSGSTETTQVLWVQGATAKKFSNPSWVAWPAAGYFPQQLEPNGRWSLSANAAWTWDFSKAKVSVTTSAGKKLKVTVESRNRESKGESGYANDTIVFNVDGVKKAVSTGAYVYKVTVTGIKKLGAKKTYTRSYTVKLFDALQK